MFNNHKKRCVLGRISAYMFLVQIMTIVPSGWKIILLNFFFSVKFLRAIRKLFPFCWIKKLLTDLWRKSCRESLRLNLALIAWESRPYGSPKSIFVRNIVHVEDQKQHPGRPSNSSRCMHVCDTRHTRSQMFEISEGEKARLNHPCTMIENQRAGCRH